jgi:hypothetical protein
MPGFRVEQTKTWFVTCASEQALRGFLIDHDVELLGPEHDSEVDVHHERAPTTTLDVDKLIAQIEARRPRTRRRPARMTPGTRRGRSPTPHRAGN